MQHAFAGAVATAVLAGGLHIATATPAGAAACTRTSAVVSVTLDAKEHQHLLRHAADAIRKGFPAVLVLHRPGADERRRKALAGTPVKRGHDRDEYPPAVGRKVVKADVRHIPSSENRSAGVILGNTLRKYCDGTKFKYAVKAAVVTPSPAPSSPAPTPDPDPTVPQVPPAGDPRFSTCTAAKKSGYGPYFRASDPEYHWYVDRDGDGVVCE